MTSGEENDVKWYEAHRDLVKTIGDFLTERRDSIVDWTGADAADGAAAFFESIVTKCMSGDFEFGGAAPARGQAQSAKKASPASSGPTGEAGAFRSAVAD